MKVSVIIPARNEQYLQQTIRNIFKQSREDIEVIAVLDGYWPDPPIEDRQGLTLIHHTESIGMRAAINEAARLARGEYLLKCDAHCLFDKGFDAKLIDDCEPDWTVVPRRYGLDLVWDTPIPTCVDVLSMVRGRQKCDYQYIRKDDFKGKDWKECSANGELIDDLMTFQGSCWFMHRQRFFDIDCLDDVNYGQMGKEAQEISCKSWLSGGRVVVNKKTWYAHLDKKERGYELSRQTKDKSRLFAIDCWMNNRWPKQTRKIEWLIRKFSPVPTWPDVIGVTTTNNVNCGGEHIGEGVFFVDEKKVHPEQSGDREGPCISKSPIEIPNLRRHFIAQKLISRIDLAPIKVRGFRRDKHLYRLFNDMGFRKGVEIGTKAGKNAERMCTAIEGLELTVVDPWIDYGDDRRFQEAEKHEAFYQEACRRLEPFNARLIRAKSMDVVGDFELRSLDFVYIDGNHGFDYVMEDLIAWSRRVRPGGIVSGHDYYRFRKGGVVEAVNAYTQVHSIGELFICDEKCPSFFWRKDA